LVKLVSSGQHPTRMITRVRVLLALDQSQGPVPDRRVVAQRTGTSQSTMYLVAQPVGLGDLSRGCELGIP
jgi:hypothetical protein